MLKECDVETFLASREALDLLIDARSPKEFSESCIVGAQNFYALNDAQHQEIGTIYKQRSRNEAKILGARYICENVAAHLQTIAKYYPIGSKIGIYCARGGLRSSSIAIILSHIGYQVYRLEGGYKRYRAYVLTFFEQLPHRRFIVLGGKTGCGKTELLKRLSPSLDIEGFANHLGSSFGAVCGAQPSQKMFENSLFNALYALEPDQSIFVEAESKRLGKVTIPARVYQNIQAGVRVEITAPFEMRTKRILHYYQNVTPEFFYRAMAIIAPYIRKSVKEAIIDAYERRDLQSVVTFLLRDYYDLVYQKPLHVSFFFDNANEASCIASLINLRETL